MIASVYDTRTAYLVGCLLFVVMPAIGWVMLRKERSASVTGWYLGGLSIGLGLLAVVMRSAAPGVLPFNTGFALCLLGTLLYLHALQMERRKPTSLQWVLGLTCAMTAFKEFLYQALSPSPVHFLVSYFSFAAVMGTLGLAARELGRREGSTSALWMGGFNLVASILFCVRGLASVAGLIHPDTLLNGIFGVITTGLVVFLGVVNNVALVGIYLERAQKKATELLLEEERARVTARLHAQIAATDRRRSLGELAAGLAHELGQPVTGILMNASSLEQELARPRPARAMLEPVIQDIVFQAERASQILAGIRNFIHPGTSTRTPVNLLEVIDSVQTMLRPMIAPDEVQILVHALAPAPLVEGDRVQLSQVFLNLLRNCLQARRPSQALVVHITLRRDGDVLCVDVQDNGTGLSDEQLAAYGSPFVSTKPDGLGIGATLCKRIVEHHGGTLSASHAPEEPGLRITLQLPCAPG